MVETLRNRNFTLLWLAQLISMTGDWVIFIALPVYMYEQTGSVLATGAMFISNLLPRLLVGSVAGVFVDRWNRKRTMIIADLPSGRDRHRAAGRYCGGAALADISARVLGIVRVSILQPGQRTRSSPSLLRGGSSSLPTPLTRRVKT